MSKLWVDTTGDNPKVVYTDTQPDVTYVDLTNSITGWYDYGNYVQDFNQIRNNVLALVLAIAQPDYSLWNDLTSDEKYVACYYVVAPYSLRITIVTDSEDKDNWRNMAELTCGNPIDSLSGRSRMFQEMRLFVSDYTRTNSITLAQAQDFFKSVFEIAQYFIQTSDPSLSYWINNTPGTIYEFDGFQQKLYYQQSIRDGLNNILAGAY